MHDVNIVACALYCVTIGRVKAFNFSWTDPTHQISHQNLWISIKRCNEDEVIMTAYTWLTESFIHDPHSTVNNKETFLRDFLAILKHSDQNLVKKCIFDTTSLAICLAYSCLQPINSMLPVSKGLTRWSSTMYVVLKRR